MPGMFKSKKLFEFWHNTLFVAQESPTSDFGKDDLDIKRKVLKTLDSSITLRLTFGTLTSQDIAFDTRKDVKSVSSLGHVHSSIWDAEFGLEQEYVALYAIVQMPPKKHLNNSNSQDH